MMTTAKKDSPKSMPKAGKDPEGGLTAAGRAYFKEKQGSNLRPGVRGAADTPEKKLRKGSFLRRHYANPRGPVVDEQGRPTRQALQAAAWGEPVPKTTADERTLADKGTQLLEQYHEAKGDAKSPSKGASRKAGAAAKTAVQTSERDSAKTAAKRTASRSTKKTAVKRTSAKKA